MIIQKYYGSKEEKMKTKFTLLLVFLFGIFISVQGQKQNLLDKCVIEGRTAKNFTTADTLDALRLLGKLDSTKYVWGNKIKTIYWNKDDTIISIYNAYYNPIKDEVEYRPEKRWYFVESLYDTVDVKTYVTWQGKPACPNCTTGEWESIYQSTLQLIPTTDITILEYQIHNFNGLCYRRAMCNNCGNIFIYKSYRLEEK